MSQKPPALHHLIELVRDTVALSGRCGLKLPDLKTTLREAHPRLTEALFLFLINVLLKEDFIVVDKEHRRMPLESRLSSIESIVDCSLVGSEYAIHSAYLFPSHEAKVVANEPGTVSDILTLIAKSKARGQTYTELVAQLDSLKKTGHSLLDRLASLGIISKRMIMPWMSLLVRPGKVNPETSLSRVKGRTNIFHLKRCWRDYLYLKDGVDIEPDTSEFEQVVRFIYEEAKSSADHTVCLYDVCVTFGLGTRRGSSTLKDLIAKYLDDFPEKYSITLYLKGNKHYARFTESGSVATSDKNNFALCSFNLGSVIAKTYELVDSNVTDVTSMAIRDGFGVSIKRAQGTGSTLTSSNLIGTTMALIGKNQTYIYMPPGGPREDVRKLTMQEVKDWVISGAPITKVIVEEEIAIDKEKFIIDDMLNDSIQIQPGSISSAAPLARKRSSAKSKNDETPEVDLAEHKMIIDVGLASQAQPKRKATRDKDPVINLDGGGTAGEGLELAKASKPKKKEPVVVNLVDASEANPDEAPPSTKRSKLNASNSSSNINNSKINNNSVNNSSNISAVNVIDVVNSNSSQNTERSVEASPPPVSTIEKIFYFFLDMFRRTGRACDVDLLNEDSKDCLASSFVDDPTMLPQLFSLSYNKAVQRFQNAVSEIESVTKIIVYLLMHAHDRSSPLNSHLNGRHLGAPSDVNGQLQLERLNSHILPAIHALLADNDSHEPEYHHLRSSVSGGGSNSLHRLNRLSLQNFALLSLLQIYLDPSDGLTSFSALVSSVPMPAVFEATKRLVDRGLLILKDPHNNNSNNNGSTSNYGVALSQFLGELEGAAYRTLNISSASDGDTESSENKEYFATLLQSLCPVSHLTVPWNLYSLDSILGTTKVPNSVDYVSNIITNLSGFEAFSQVTQGFLADDSQACISHQLFALANLVSDGGKLKAVNILATKKEESQSEGREPSVQSTQVHVDISGNNGNGDSFIYSVKEADKSGMFSKILSRVSGDFEVYSGVDGSGSTGISSIPSDLDSPLVGRLLGIITTRRMVSYQELQEECLKLTGNENSRDNTFTIIDECLERLIASYKVMRVQSINNVTPSSSIDTQQSKSYSNASDGSNKESSVSTKVGSRQERGFSPDDLFAPFISSFRNADSQVNYKLKFDIQSSILSTLAVFPRASLKRLHQCVPFTSSAQLNEIIDVMVEEKLIQPSIVKAKRKLGAPFQNYELKEEHEVMYKIYSNK